MLYTTLTQNVLFYNTLYLYIYIYIYFNKAATFYDNSILTPQKVQ
jgi:hypothetical protein